MFPRVQQAATDYHQVAHSDGEPVTSVKIPGHVLHAQQEPVLDAVHVDEGRQRPAVSRQRLTNVVAARIRCVDAAPSHELGAPRDIGIFAISEEIVVEKLAVDRDIVDHLAPVEGGRRSGSENILVLAIMAVVFFEASAVKMSQVGSEVDPGGIDYRFGRKVEAGGHGQQLAADSTGTGIDLAGIVPGPG